MTSLVGALKDILARRVDGNSIVYLVQFDDGSYWLPRSELLKEHGATFRAHEERYIKAQATASSRAPSSPELGLGDDEDAPSPSPPPAAPPIGHQLAPSGLPFEIRRDLDVLKEVTVLRQETKIDRVAINTAVQVKYPGRALKPTTWANALPYTKWRALPAMTRISIYEQERTTSAPALKLSRRNLRFLLGILENIMDEGDVLLSAFGNQTVALTIIEILELRNVKASRRHQVLLELAVIQDFLLACHSGTDSETMLRAHIRPETIVPAYATIKGYLKEQSRLKKRDRSIAASMTTTDLVREGKWLPREEQDRVATATTTWLINAVINKPPRTPQNASKYQDQLVLWLLNSNCVPVPRSQVLLLVRIGEEFTFDETRQRYVIHVRSDSMMLTKTRTPVMLIFPEEANDFLDAWVNEWRPILLGSRVDTGHLLIKVRGAAGPRCELASLVAKAMSVHNARPVTPHSFRSMQAVDVRDAGASLAEHKAIARGRQHSYSTSQRFYEFHDLERQAEIAGRALERVRAAKRQRLQAGLNGESQSSGSSESSATFHMNQGPPPLAED